MRPLSDVEDGHRSGLAGEPRSGQPFALEAFPDALVRRVAVRQHFHDNFPAEDVVGRGEDVAHRAASDQARRAIPRRKCLRLHGHAGRIPAFMALETDGKRL